MSEGAGGVDVPKALFYFIGNCDILKKRRKNAPTKRAQRENDGDQKIKKPSSKSTSSKSKISSSLRK